MKSLPLCLLVLVLASASTPVWAIGTITDGDVQFGFTNDFATRRSNTVDTLLTGPGGGNQVSESWWFFRVAGDDRELAFGAPDIELYEGSIARLEWSDPGQSGLFSAVLALEVIDSGVGEGNLFQSLAIVNTGSTALSIELFHYTDLNVAGSSNGDSAALDAAPDGISMTVRDGLDSASLVAFGADAFHVGRSNRVLRDLTDDRVDDLDGSGLPFDSGDFTAAFQWSQTVGVGERSDFLSQIASNAPLLPATAATIPEPGTAVLILAGLCVLRLTPRRLV